MSSPAESPRASGKRARARVPTDRSARSLPPSRREGIPRWCLLPSNFANPADSGATGSCAATQWRKRSHDVIEVEDNSGLPKEEGTPNGKKEQTEETGEEGEDPAGEHEADAPLLLRFCLSASISSARRTHGARLEWTRVPDPSSRRASASPVRPRYLLQGGLSDHETDARIQPRGEGKRTREDSENRDQPQKRGNEERERRRWKPAGREPGRRDRGQRRSLRRVEETKPRRRKRSEKRKRSNKERLRPTKGVKPPHSARRAQLATGCGPEIWLNPDRNYLLVYSISRDASKRKVLHTQRNDD
ncbi:hypothetical protein TGVAND_365990 [Toxoplasma gondii VAND]|uniref:Uncharacterized protein n=1 Tax=Toxoplasma gondii VAND TaxID=933077 RepID=A0A086QE01_TOXGO|nr:hypothetical protein TGVAND_365990 [Toxoplasma gondii VAND]